MLTSTSCTCSASVKLTAVKLLCNDCWKKGITNVQHLKQAEYYKALMSSKRKADTGDIVFDDDDIHEVANSKPGNPTRRSYRLQESFAWGAASFRFRRPTAKKGPGFQVVCPRASHTLKNKKGGATICQCTIYFKEAIASKHS